MGIRKSTMAMREDEWLTINNAINRLVRSGKWNDLYLMHAERGANHRMHGSMSGEVGYARFLYWHRAYLIECESALKEIDSNINIPYWDWLNSRTVPSGLSHMPIRGVSRNRGIIDFTNEAEIARVMSQDSFDDFVFELEVYPHNNGHNWVGGIMSHPMDSPTDPLFYMHHANIDRIWSDWQALQGNENKKPITTKNDSLLDPWKDKWNIDNIHKISDLAEYSYEYGSVVSRV